VPARIEVTIYSRSEACKELGYDDPKLAMGQPDNQGLSDELNMQESEASGCPTLVGPLVVDDDHYAALEGEGVLIGAYGD
jgi:hypothetical protein